MKLERPKGGRYPEAYKAHAVEKVFEGMSAGKSLAAVCKENDLPAARVRSWIISNEDYAYQYRQARLLMAQALVDRALHLAHNTTNHTIGRDRLEIDTLRWVAARMNPAEFGDRQIVDGNQNTTLEIKVVEEEAPMNVREKPVQKVAEAVFEVVE
jgi:hypothetical protein